MLRRKTAIVKLLMLYNYVKDKDKRAAGCLDSKRPCPGFKAIPISPDRCLLLHFIKGFP